MDTLPQRNGQVHTPERVNMPADGFRQIHAARLVCHDCNLEDFPCLLFA
jgi:hypothetical protein